MDKMSEVETTAQIYKGLILGMMGVSDENLRTPGHQGSTAQRRLDQDLFI